jgi:5-methylcytosine-specific restriction enzyme subunit McrC
MIPIQNVYYLLLYAWKHSQTDDDAMVQELKCEHPQDLLGHVLSHAVAGLMASGLARDYLPSNEIVVGIRGKLDIGATVKRNMLVQARTVCDVDEFARDIPRNRILKAAVCALLRVDHLDAEVKAKLRHVAERMRDVSDVRVTRQHFAQLQAHRHVRSYDLPLRVCELVLNNVLVQPRAGTAGFHDFREDKATMWRLFEDFMLQFYKREAGAYRVRRTQINWFNALGAQSDLERLPIMRTDVVLESPERSIILDAKYYPKALQGWRGGEKIRSAHLYQLFAYLENQSAARPKRRYEGMLLYPVIKDPFSFTFEINGHQIAVRSIDLGQSWDGIRADMLELVA